MNFVLVYSLIFAIFIVLKVEDSGVARGGFGGVQPPIRIEAVFFTAVKSLLLNIITTL